MKEISFAKSFVFQIPRRLKIHEFFIINQAESHLPGTHWMLILKDQIKVHYFYDPLGSSEEYVQKNFNHLGGSIEFVNSATQARDSVRCGEFCIYFLYSAVTEFDFTFEDLVNHCFSSDLEENEMRVKNFMKQHVPSREEAGE